MEKSSSFSEWFEKRLRESGLDGRTVAAKAGISQPYLSMLKRGKRSNPRRETVIELAAALDANRDEALLAANLLSAEVNISRDRVHDRGRQSAEPNWSCRLEVGKEAFEIEVARKANKPELFSVRISLQTREPGDERLKQRDHDVSLGEGFTFRLFPRAEHMTCEVRQETEEFVLRVPLSLLRSHG